MRSLDLRPIEPIDNDGSVAKTFGPVPELRWLPIAQLRADPAYQRPIGRAAAVTIRVIAKSFDWRKFGPVVVSPIAGGVFAIVDGQCRTTAAAMCGVEEVPCLVIQADRDVQAAAFAAINGRTTRVTALDLYKARLASGDETAVAMCDVAASAGVEILIYPVAASNMKPRQTLACGTIEKMLAVHGRAVVRLALEAIGAAAKDDIGCFSALVIRAFCEVIADNRGMAAWELRPGVRRDEAVADHRQGLRGGARQTNAGALVSRSGADRVLLRAVRKGAAR